MGDLSKKEATKPFKFNGLIAQIVRPWGVEPQSMEPESIILSIELWAHSIFNIMKSGTKIISLSELGNKVPCKILSIRSKTYAYK